MKVAVLMSTYNGEKYLDEQLKSLANQTVATSMKVYIRDDGSTDRTFDIIEYWKQYISIVLKKGNNVGPATSFWELLQDKSIQADYYAFCDQDDIWDSDKIEKGIQQLQMGYTLTCCNCRIIDSNGLLLKEKNREERPDMALPKMFVTGFVQGCAMVFTDDVRNRFCNLNLTSIPMHDVIMTMYLSSGEQIYWDHSPRFSYRVHENNVTVKQKKSLIKRVLHTWKSWKNSSRNSMATVAKEMLENRVPVSIPDRDFLIHMQRYRDSIKNKLWLIRYETIQDVEYRALRSYKIRILLNLL